MKANSGKTHLILELRIAVVALKRINYCNGQDTRTPFHSVGGILLLNGEVII